MSSENVVILNVNMVDQQSLMYQLLAGEEETSLLLIQGKTLAATILQCSCLRF